MVKKNSYPQNRHEWSTAIEQGLGITRAQGEELCRNGCFPKKELAEWLKDEYGEIHGPDFVPALLRNINGLIAWVYGDRPEPFWPGKDPDPANK